MFIAFIVNNNSSNIGMQLQLQCASCSWTTILDHSISLNWMKILNWRVQWSCSHQQLYIR